MAAVPETQQNVFSVVGLEGSQPIQADTFGVVATKDPDKARLRFLSALRRITTGLEIQRTRIMDRSAQASKLFAGTANEIVGLRGDLGNDLDYYVYELARLQDLAREVNKAFGKPADVVDALAAFDRAIPNLRKIRNPLTHASDDERLDAVMWFDSVVEVRPNGAVEYLVDPRYQHHSAALELSRALSTCLEAGMPIR